MARKALNLLYKTIDCLSIILVVAMVLFVFLQVICRRINIATPWTEEMARFSFVYITFLGSILAAKDENHIMIDVLLNRFHPRVRYLIQAVTYLASGIFLLLFSRGTYETIKTSGDVAAASLMWFKHSYLYGVVLFSGVMMFCFCISHMVRCLGLAFGKEGGNR